MNDYNSKQFSRLHGDGDAGLIRFTRSTEDTDKIMVLAQFRVPQAPDTCVEVSNVLYTSQVKRTCENGGMFFDVLDDHTFCLVDSESGEISYHIKDKPELTLTFFVNIFALWVVGTEMGA